MAVSSAGLRKLMVANGFEWRCARCGISEWLGEKAPLHIDHISGERANCNSDNLRFLCPNCHALTPTYGGKNVRRRRVDAFTSEEIVLAYNSIVKDGTLPSATSLVRSTGRYPRTYWVAKARDVCESEGLRLATASEAIRQTRKDMIDWPTDAELSELLSEMPVNAIGEMLGVSGNAVKKRCHRRGVPLPQKRKTLPLDAATRERRASKLREVRLTRLETQHGTTNGYNLELVLNIPTCSLCRKANLERVINNRNK